MVDKMPDNVNLAGWIRLVFPNAKIIHCRRDLRDIALSCYQTCFGSIRWANDWRLIARRFSDYLRVVNHWESMEGMDWLDFSYEQVIENTEEYARKLIDYVGLEWEPGCLNFHETKRQVRTESQESLRDQDVEDQVMSVFAGGHPAPSRRLSPCRAAQLHESVHEVVWPPPQPWPHQERLPSYPPGA